MPQRIIKGNQIDKTLFIIICLLLLWGTVSFSTVSFSYSLYKHGNSWHYFIHQMVILAISLFLGFAAFKIPIKLLKKWAPFFFLLNLALLLLVFIPKIGIEFGGSRRWISIGNFLFQPSEFLKITFILYLAAWLSNKINKNKNEKKKLNSLFFVFIAILTSLIIMLMAEPDMSTLIIIAGTGFLMYFAASTPLWQSIAIGALGLTGGMIFIKNSAYRHMRLIAFLNPNFDPMGSSFHLNQSFIAIGSGRIFGSGNHFSLGLNSQKLSLLPHPMSDSIFAIIAEEFGFLGSLLLIGLFLAFFWRSIKIAVNSRDDFSKFLALGISLWIITQAFLNISGLTGSAPMGGVPLPFFSYGGSHLLTEIIGMGILLNISRNSN